MLSLDLSILSLHSRFVDLPTNQPHPHHHQQDHPWPSWMERGQLLGTEKVWLKSQFTESRHLEHKLRRVEPLVLAGLLGQGDQHVGGGGGQSYVEGFRQ